MTGWKDILFVSREKRFIDYLVNQVVTTNQGVQLLLRFLREGADGDGREGLIERMSQIEKRGDEIRGAMIQDLRTTFVTPIDREDIYALSRSVDDILDYADSTVKELVVYEVEATPAMIDMVATLADAVGHLQAAIETITDDADTALQETVRAKKSENRIEDLYRRANAALFSETDIHYIFKVREIYRHLSNCADRLDEAADVIGSIVIKGNV